jgi:hypothetical protein
MDQEEIRSQLATLGKAIYHPVPNWTAMFSQDYLSHTQMFLDLNIHKSSLQISKKEDINFCEINN